MRLLLTCARPGGPLTDVVVDCDDDATVADVAAGVAGQVRGPRELPDGLRIEPHGRLGVVTATPGADRTDSTRAGAAPELWVDGVRLDPGARASQSVLRHGALVGLDGPIAATAAEPAGVVELRVVSGPAAGTVRRLGPGTHRVGPEPAAVLRLPDGAPSVDVEVDVDGRVQLVPQRGHDGVRTAPRRATSLDGPIVLGVDAPTTDRRGRTVAGQRRAVDPDLDGAAVELGRVPVTGPVPWAAGTTATLGESLVELWPPTAADASLSPSPAGATLDYNRPPRLLPAARATEFALPKAPAAPGRQPIPFLVALSPMVMSVGMAILWHRPTMLLFALASPIMLAANWWQGRRGQRMRYGEQLAEHHRKSAAIEQAALAALDAEREARRRDLPDPAALLLQATGPRARLWERRPVDPDWLRARVGTADQPSDVRLRDPGRERHQGDLHWTAPDVPVEVDLGQVVGVAGPADLRRRVVTWLVGQAAVLHSPADLSLALLVGPVSRDGDEPGPDWSWVRWLPHVRRDDGAEVAAVGTDRDSVGRRVAELTAALEARREAAQGRAGVPFAPTLVVLDGARALRLLPGMVPLLRDGPSYGLFFVCLDADVTLLPEECRVVVAPEPGLVGEQRTWRVQATGRGPVEGIRLDLVPDGWAERVGRALAPVRDVSAVAAAGQVPSASRLLEVLRLDPPTPAALGRRWARSGGTTRAVIGEGAHGPFAVDLRRDGPHGLVAGTTGSGKSELLQTLIASLASANRPDEMTFVLVDYKGGAAFKDCAHLPHTVGMVTDLDGHLTSRALESLGAELRRREHLLAGAGAKDVDDYLAERGPADPPLPRLVIVIDEFAALVAELPDFVTGLVDIARRGRSLGVHLILATQRPAGVVSADITSNTNLRIALRVTDPADSQDVIESTLAAEISSAHPGRAYARLGHAQLELFQSSRVGGRPRGEGPATVRVRPLELATLGTPAPPVVAEEDAGDVATDLARLVTAVSAAADELGLPPQPSPWLPALPESVSVDALEPPAAVAGRVAPLRLGLADLPALQRQETMTWDLAVGGHLAVAGQPRSGRSTVLRQLAAEIGRGVDPRDLHLYGIDCGNGALLPLVTMPHVGAVVTRDQGDRVRRLLALLGAEVARRQQLLARGSWADIGEQRAAVADPERLPYLVVLLDRWEGFVAAFEQQDAGVLLEQFVGLLREGLGVGLRAVVTGDRTLFAGRIGTALEDRLVLRMPGADDYHHVGLRPRDVPTSMPPGRAFRSGEVPTEVQVAMLDADPSGTAQVAALQALSAAAAERAGSVPVPLRPRRVDELPVLVDRARVDALRERPAAPTELLVGVGGDTLGPQGVDVERDGPGLLVVGPPRSGRSTALLATVLDALEREWRVVVLAPRRSPLRDLAMRPRVRVLGGEATADELRAALEVPGPRMVVVDDVEVLGADHPTAAVLEDYLRQIRDSGDALLVSCGLDEVTGLYRGVVSALRKTRTGVLLAPRSAADGDVFSTRLPRSVGAAVPVGRAVLIRGGAWEWVQVPFDPADDAAGAGGFR